MIREYLGQNVYEAFQERLRFIFEEFDNIYIFLFQEERTAACC